MKKILIAGIAAAAFCGAPAFAADMPVKAAPVALFNWTGCYIGGNTGGAWKDVRTTYNPGGDLAMNHTFDGWVGGGQIGCDYQANNNWIVGIQGMWDVSGVGGTTADIPNPGDSIHLKATSFGTVAATLGYLVNPTTKIYGKAGYGWVREHSTYTCGGSLDGCLLTSVESATISETRGGFDAGVGLTWMFQRNWDLFVEYDHMWLGSKNATYNFPTSSADFGVTNKESFSKLLVGIDYRFGGPVVAKY